MDIESIAKLEHDYIEALKFKLATDLAMRMNYLTIFTKRRFKSKYKLRRHKAWPAILYNPLTAHSLDNHPIS